MAVTLSEVVAWGRDFEEYRALFALSDENLTTELTRRP